MSAFHSPLIDALKQGAGQGEAQPPAFAFGFTAVLLSFSSSRPPTQEEAAVGGLVVVPLAVVS